MIHFRPRSVTLSDSGEEILEMEMNENSCFKLAEIILEKIIMCLFC